MSRLRAIVVCLLMLALPLQGFAAAAMVACGLPARANAAGTMHHDMHDMTAATADSHAAAAQHSHGDMKAQGHASSHDAQGSQLGADHKCSVCSVCHSAALLDMPLIAEAHPLPDARPAPVPRAMASLVPTLPDKPPRA